jgi:fluoride ion exporter CrcB/FEX
MEVTWRGIHYSFISVPAIMFANILLRHLLFLVLIRENNSSFTTFSTFSVDVVGWLSEGKTTKAISYVATNNIGGIVAAGVGMALVKRLFG